MDKGKLFKSLSGFANFIDYNVQRFEAMYLKIKDAYKLATSKYPTEDIRGQWDMVIDELSEFLKSPEADLARTSNYGDFKRLITDYSDGNDVIEAVESPLNAIGGFRQLLNDSYMFTNRDIGTWIEWIGQDIETMKSAKKIIDAFVEEFGGSASGQMVSWELLKDKSNSLLRFVGKPPTPPNATLNDYNTYVDNIENFINGLVSGLSPKFSTMYAKDIGSIMGRINHYRQATQDYEDELEPFQLRNIIEIIGSIREEVEVFVPTVVGWLSF